MRRFAFVFCTLALSVTAFAGKTAAELNAELRIAMSQEFENPNPLIMQMAATSYIYSMCGRTLNMLGPDGKVINQLAVSTPQVGKGAELYKDGDKTKLKVTWEIREGAKWGDGKPVTGHDLKFTWEVGKHDNVSVGEKEGYTNIEKIDIDPENSRKFTIFYKVAKWDFYKMFGFYIMPKHIEGPIFSKHADQKLGYDKNSNYTRNPTNPGLYNGPYRVAEVKLGSHVILVPNEHFFGNRPKIKKIVLRFIPETATLSANLLAGGVDMISVLGLTFDQALAFRKQVAKEKLVYSVNFKDGLVYEHLDVNLRNPILKDINVRKALVHAINRDALSLALFEGMQKKAIHNIAPIDPWYTDDAKKIVVYRYSPRKARKLLEGAGWKLGEDGIRVKGRQKLTFKLMTTSGNKVRANVQQWLQNEWKKVGVETTIKNEPANVYFGETVRKAKYPGMAMYAWLSSPENTPRSTFHSKSIPTKENSYSGQNSTGWKNPAVDKLIDQLEQQFDPAKRPPLAHQLLKYYTDEVPVIPLYYRSNTSVTPKSLKGYRLSGHQYSSANHVEDWYFE